MRNAVEFILLAVCVFLTVDAIARITLWLWYASDYAIILLGGVLFIGAIFLIDSVAEQQGWIVHHWWDS